MKEIYLFSYPKNNNLFRGGGLLTISIVTLGTISRRLLASIADEEDILKLQRDIDRLGRWARKWGMRL